MDVGKTPPIVIAGRQRGSLGTSLEFLMAKLPLTIAISSYDHVTDLLSGRVPVEGVDLNPMDLPLHDIFYRFIHFKDFDIGEMSMAKYVSMRSAGDDSIIALPIFPSRVARHSSIYVRKDRKISKPADLAGKRVAVPEWAQTAAVYSRGLLAHEYGVDLASIRWVQAGQDQPGRMEKVELKLPKGIEVERITDRSISQMLASGDLDAALLAQPPKVWLEKHPQIARMFPDYMPVEHEYMTRTKIIPIMHTVAMRKTVLDRHPWVAANLLHAFTEAKDRSVERMLYGGVTHVPILWCYEHAERTKEIFGGDPYPYGVEANRHTLEVFLKYAHEQGVCHRLLKVEELFPPQVLSSYRV